MMRKIIYLLLLSQCLTIFTAGFAQGLSNKQKISRLYNALNTNFKAADSVLYYETTNPAKNENPHSWLWPLCAYIQAAEEMESVFPKGRYMKPVELAIEQYYNPEPLPAYQDYVLKERPSSKFYDDNQWIAIAYLDAYNRNHQKRYLKTAKMIYDFQLGGIDTAAGGGIYWKAKDFTTKNTCSNGPGILVALQLYKVTREQAYLDTALSLYHWVNRYLQSPGGVYYDAISLPSMKINKATYTYNTGTMLQSNVLLYHLTKENKYLQEAQRIAAAGRDHFFKNGRLPKEYWFNAVMLRGYAALYEIDGNKKWIDFFEQDAEAVWNDERNAADLVGARRDKRLIDQAATIEILSVLEQVASRKK